GGGRGDGVVLVLAGRVGLLPLFHLVDGAGDLPLFLDVLDRIDSNCLRGCRRGCWSSRGGRGASRRGAAVVRRRATLGPQEVGLGAADERGSDQPGQTPLADLLPDHLRVPFSRLEVGSRAGFVTAATRTEVTSRMRYSRGSEKLMRQE